MAVQVGRTVVSFTIKYVQTEKEKLKSDISKVLDSKGKSFKAGLSKPAIQNQGMIQPPLGGGQPQA